MKKFIVFILFFFSFLGSFCQGWTAVQLDSASTANDISYLTDIEKAVVRYINLARLYPQLFIKNELADYNGSVRFGDYLKNSSYKKSLAKDLNNRKPLSPLQFDKGLYELAKCFAKETGASGAVTHKRKRCPYGYLGECCSYGMDTGKDIALQWLIDDKVPGTGHRANCLSPEYTLIGIAFNEHKVYRQCAVADFR